MEKVRCYLLSVEELNRAEMGETLYEEALRRLDSTRLEKARHMHQGKSCSLSVGAGLLLQLAALELSQSQELIVSEEKPLLTVSGVLDRIGSPIEIAYRYGPNGKPDFAEGGWHFNLSHSGEYVCCVLAPFAVGVDLQQMRRQAKTDALAKRFFSEEEKRRLEEQSPDKREELFYRMWTRKESYAKLTGEGIVSAVGRDTLELEAEVVWQEYEAPKGYRMSVCHFKNLM